MLLLVFLILLVNSTVVVVQLRSLTELLGALQLPALIPAWLATVSALWVDLLAIAQVLAAVPLIPIVIPLGRMICARAYTVMLPRVARNLMSATLVWFHALMASLVSETRPIASWLLPLVFLVCSVARMGAV